MSFKRGVLTPLETLAQSIAGIAPSATPGMLIPIVFGFAGNGTWLAYLLATIGMLFTAQCINVFASRQACHGSLYTFVSQGLGARAGIYTGWAMLFAYIFCGAVCVTEFALFAISLTHDFLHLSVNGYLMMLASTLITGYIAIKNIKLSASLMLWLELLSISLILLVVVIALGKQDTAMDLQQLKLSTVNFENVRMGLTLAIFGFVAFESAASLGFEAADPLKSVPRALLMSVMLSGGFFVFVSYVMVFCLRGQVPGLAQCSTPLLALSSLIGMPVLGHFIDAGIMLSFFAAGLANLNAAARMLHKMSEDGFFHRIFSDTHKTNQTPHNAAALASTISLLIALTLAVLGCPLLEIVGLLGTLATFGFIFAYVLTSISAAKLLHSIKQLTTGKMLSIVSSVAVLLASLIGSLYPAPPPPYNLLPFIFVVYMAVAAVCTHWRFKTS